MKATSIIHLGGRGNRATYQIMHGGEPCGEIRCGNNRGHWYITGYYSLPLGNARGIDAARDRVMGLDFPTGQEAYDRICAEVLIQRRNVARHYFALRIASLAEQVLDGSNSARAELVDLFDEIERVAQDRARSTVERYDYEKVAGEEIQSLRRYPQPPPEGMN